jgi:DNA segregation ATPase FtsK/SpoIIIE, S-DNA-T family
MKTITCTECNGLGKKIAGKAGAVKLLICKPCKGKGKIKVEAGSKAAKSAPKKAVAKAAPKKKVVEVAARRGGKTAKAAVTAKQAKADGITVFSRDLEDGSEGSTRKLTPEQRLAKETIEERAAFFGCPGKVKDIRKGPVITLYEFAPAKTTRIKRLVNLQEDLALALGAEAVMVRRIPGREVMGIEISNESGDRQNVAFRASLKYVIEAKQKGMALPLNLGTDPFGDPIVDDLATMPHLMIAGSTGSGKSVSLNCIISSLLTVCSPEELEFYMIDPKGVELTHYNGIPHMKVPMVTSPHYAKDMLEKLVETMRERLRQLTRAGVRDIVELNALHKQNGQPTMPRIVVVIDELGDLMMQDRREFTRLIAEISQIARATGIHMICATQRPSVDVLSGRIKVNFPGRMAFKVTSSVDSRTIIHRKGAEGLLGRGDMLYLSPTRSATVRIHAPWVPLDDVRLIAGKLREIEEQRKRDEAAKREAEFRARQAELARVATPAAPARTIPVGERETQDITFGWSSVTKTPTIAEKMEGKEIPASWKQVTPKSK